MTMPVEVLRKIEAAARLEAEEAEQEEGREGPRPVADAAPGLYARIARWFGIRRDDVNAQSMGSSERPFDER